MLLLHLSDISRFRKVVGGLLTLVILTLVFAMTLFGTRSSGSAQCTAVVERIAVEMEEMEELSKRMQQRQLFDQFLDAEKEVTAHNTCLVPVCAEKEVTAHNTCLVSVCAEKEVTAHNTCLVSCVC